MSEATDDAAERRRHGEDWFGYVMHFPLSVIETPYMEAIGDFVFSEMWSRPALDMRSRRWITLSCVASSGAESPIRTHVHAALKSGDVSIEEMREFILHFAVYAGWPKASTIQIVAEQAWAGIQAEGGVERLPRPEPRS